MCVAFSSTRGLATGWTGKLHHPPWEEEAVSIVAVIVIVVVALLLLAMLLAGARKAARVRSTPDLGAVDDDVTPYRSHAEASRRSDSSQL
jgi:hypothetical protein